MANYFGQVTMKINKILEFIGENNSKYKNYIGISEIDDDNLKQGYWEFFYEKGKLLAKGNFINNKKEGYWEFYWDNGNLREKGHYKNNYAEGLWFDYWYNGNILSKGYYKNDNAYGEWYYYNKKGEFLYIENY